MSDEKQIPLEPKKTIAELAIGWWIEEMRSHDNTFSVMCDYIRENNELKKRIEELEQRNGT